MELNINKIKAVIFDMDGVIFDTELVYLKVWSEVFEKYGYKLKKEIYKKFKNNYILLVKSSCLDIKKRLKFWLFYKNQFLTSKFWRIKKSL